MEKETNVQPEEKVESEGKDTVKGDDVEVNVKRKLELTPAFKNLVTVGNQYEQILATMKQPAELAMQMLRENIMRIDATAKLASQLQMTTHQHVLNAMATVRIYDINTLVPKMLRESILDAHKHVIQNSLQPHEVLLKTVKEMDMVAVNAMKAHDFSAIFVKISKQASEAVNTSKRLKGYKESPYFWVNVKKISKELISIPENHSDELLDYLCQETIDMEYVKVLIGEFDVMELERELQDEEHNDYRFKKYLKENLKLHTAHPEHYRVYIPAFFSIIEGTLGDIFNISKKGTAVEIKRKISIFFDLIDHVYTNESFELKFTFSNQLFLQNVKELFMELTKSSVSDGEVKLNRNLALHGKDNPEDWTYNDFLSLAHLMKHVLSIRRTAVILSEDFVSLIKEEEIQGKPIILSEYRITIEKTHAHKVFKNIEEQKSFIKSMKKTFKSDVKSMFLANPSVVTLITERCDVKDILHGLGKLT